MAKKSNKLTRNIGSRKQAKSKVRTTPRKITTSPIRDRHYADLYDSSPVGHLTLDTSGTIVRANLKAAALLDIDRKELIGQSLTDIIAVEDQDLFRQHCQKVMKTGTRQTCELHFLEKSHISYCLYLDSLAIQEKSGRSTHWQTVLLDITDRKQARDIAQGRMQQLEQQERKLHGLAKNQKFHAGQLKQSLPEVTECATQTLSVERGSVWLFDNTASVLLQHDLYEATPKRHSNGITLHRSSFPSYFHALDMEQSALNANNALTDPRTCEFAESYLIPLKIGAMLDAPIWWKGRLAGVLCLEHIGNTRAWTKDEQVFVVSLAAMVTIALEADELRHSQERSEEQVLERTAELQQTNQVLQETTTHLHTILEQSPLSIIELNQDGCVTRWNNAATQMFGWTETEVLGQELPYLYQGEKEESTRLWTSIIQGKAVQNRELRWLKKDGTPVDVSFSGIGLRTADGHFSGSIFFLIDITERKRLETQFRQAQKMEAVGRLAGGVAHDFNNLLTIMNGYSSLLIEQLSPEDPRHSMAAETFKAGKQAGELTKQLLAFSRQQVLRPQPLDLNDSIRSISSMLMRLLGEDIALTTDLASDLWKIHSDKGQLDQVTMNLVVNARDAMPHGGKLTIATRNVVMVPVWPDRHWMMPPGDYVHLSICDSGCGMSFDTLTHMFEPFFTTKPEGKGTGLGLATVYGIVKQSQGYIFADSMLDHGTTFHLYYPRVDAVVTAAETQQIHRMKGSERLLVVEDQDAVRALIVQVLKQQGYRVIDTAGGEDALRIAASLPDPVQALVTDVVMPDMSGLVLAERLRQVWPGTRVLFMSGYSDKINPAILDEPGTSYIQKPFLPDKLAQCLRDLLDKST